MIDPDGIIVQQHNYNNIIKFGNDIPNFDFVVYDLEDTKDFNKYISTIEKEIRSSYEYKSMINYLRDNMGMDSCSFIQVSNKDSYAIKIEIHHYPFTLFDIVNIVYKKRCYYQEPLEVQMIAKEVTMLHYKLLIGLIPLSTTAHQLAHAGKLFIPIQNVLGRYNFFIDFYKDFCDQEQLDTLIRIEKYSREQVSDLLNSQSILEQNNITIQNSNNSYILPDFNNINNSLNNRIDTIKNNGYRLPTLKDNPIPTNNNIDNINSKSISSPFFFSRKE